MTGNNYYYLTKDVSVRRQISIYSDQVLYLCLHGNDLTGYFSWNDDCIFIVQGTGKLFLCDCKGSSTNSWGRITTNGKGRGIWAGNSARVEIYGGNITNNYYDGSEIGGGGIYIEDDALVTMYDGAITDNKVDTYGWGGGVHPSRRAIHLQAGLLRTRRARKLPAPSLRSCLLRM